MGASKKLFSELRELEQHDEAAQDSIINNHYETITAEYSNSFIRVDPNTRNSVSEKQYPEDNSHDKVKPSSD